MLLMVFVCVCVSQVPIFQVIFYLVAPSHPLSLLVFSGSFPDFTH